MSYPRDHHYCPIFYLQQWARDDQQVCEYELVPAPERRIITIKREYPSATGFKRDLYRVDGLPEDIAQSVEMKFMGMVDEGAALALADIVEGNAEWSGRRRSDWIRFILSLIFRNPEVVQSLKRHMANLYREGIAVLEATYEKQRRPHDPETFEEFHSRMEPAASAKAALMLLQEVIDNPKIGPAIFKMRWHRIDLRHSKLTLVTSDRPVELNLGQGDLSYASLPVGPKLLFVADDDGRMARHVAQNDPTKIVRAINKGTVARARRFVWGLDDGHEALIRKWIGTGSDREIITPAQREAALKAARGE